MNEKISLNKKGLTGQLPKGLKQFLIRAILLFVGWKLLYIFVLEPTDFPDKQLIDLVLLGTVQLLKPFYSQLTIVGDTIFINGSNTLTVAQACNGLELIVLYIGFLLCLPTSTKRVVAFSIGGFVAICVLNMLRCAALGIMFYKNHQLADFAHHYIFKLIIYGVTFFLWIWYSKKYKAYEKQA